MHDVVTTVVVAAGAFIGTSIDNFIAFAAQLALTDRRRFARASYGQLTGVVTLIVISGGVGTALEAIPLRAVGALAFVPIILAVIAWRKRGDPRHVAKRGAVTTFLITVALGGDNIAVWVPILRADGLHRGALAAGVFVALDVVLISLARVTASHPKVIAVSTRWSPRLTPVLYGALAVVIAWQCHWL